MSMTLKFTWAGLLCGAVLLGCYELRRSALAATAPAAAGESPVNGSLSVPGPDRVLISGIEEDEISSFPYQVIMERNPFRLNPPPPPPLPPQPPPPDLPTVILSGTRKEAGKTVVMFAVKYKKTAKEPESTTYMSLTEGQEQGPVALLEIAPGGDEVTIMNSTSTRQVLTMKDNGFGSKSAGGGGPPPPNVIPKPATTAGGGTSLAATIAAAGGLGSGNSGVNVGSTTGGQSSRHTGDMIVGGPSAPSRTPTTTTTTPQAITVATGNVYAGSTAAYGGGISVGGAYTTTPTPTPPQPGPTPQLGITNFGGTPLNFATPGTLQPGGIMPPMPTLPTSLRR